MDDLFKRREFISHSGKKLMWEIDCQTLSDAVWDLFVDIYMETRPVSITFGRVQGIPRGGLRFARALDKRIVPESDGILVVDDVLTTGNSFNDAFNDMHPVFERPYAFGVCAFDRSMEPLPPTIFALFSQNGPKKYPTDRIVEMIKRGSW